jgi:hypothetical protein
VRFVAVVTLVAALSGVALAEPTIAAVESPHPTLQLLPSEKVAALAPLLQHGDIALIESNGDGTMKQVTLFMFVAAKPETVHDVIASPGEYGKYVPNLSTSKWQKLPDGRMVHYWQLDLPVSEFDGVNAYDFEPGQPGQPGAIKLHAVDPNDEAIYRWEMVPVPGGTVLVQYGYTDVKHSNSFVRGFLKRQPTMEHGLALAAQLMLASPMRAEAQKRTTAGSLPAVDKGARSPGFNFLLERGVVTIMRSREDGRLSDVSVLDRAFAGIDPVVSAITHPADYVKFVPGIDESYERSRDAGTVEYRVTLSVPLVSWNTVYTMRIGPSQVEGIAVSGDLRGAHFQWDLSKRGPKETLVVYRVNEPLAQSSIILRKLFSSQPSLEHGLGVAFSLVYVRAMRGRAEGWASK